MLVLVILVRSSSAYLLALIAVGGLWRLRTVWSERSRRLELLREARRLLVIGAVSLAVMVALVPVLSLTVAPLRLSAVTAKSEVFWPAATV